MRCWKGHALGNDYIVVDGTGGDPPSPELIRWMCDRHRGVGADGVLVADLEAEPVGLRIFNPDGGEAEKSGNGLRIFGAWLDRIGRATDAPFLVALPGEAVELRVVSRESDGSLTLSVDMGTASFLAGDVALAGFDPGAEVVGEALEFNGERLAIHAVSMGNPHCVVFVDRLDPDRFRRLAPVIQADPRFERGINVQFARVRGPASLEARIWERGAGETLASGSSACAVAAAARRSGRVDGDAFEVRMAGGSVTVELDPEYGVRLTGPAVMVFEGRLGIDYR
jgi:diaminopimelate epimerase